MAVLIGVDEAGLGPVLGPLVVSGAAFRVPDERADDCLWKLLRGSCTKRVRRGRVGGRKLTVADSKKLYSPGGSIAGLERTALVLLASAGVRPESFRGLLEAVAPEAWGPLDGYPWYAGQDLSLPVCADTGDVGTRANAVLGDCRRQGVEPCGFAGEAVAEGQFNDLIERTHNKSAVVSGLALRVVDLLLRASGARRARIQVDRLGGRMRYREMLQVAFPGYELRIVEESPTRSAYRLAGARLLEFEFSVNGERRHFAVAAASVMSKYVRELYMRLFNRFWSTEAEGVAPTAGYYNDAQRWLREAAPHIARLGVDRAALVRSR